MKVTFGWRRLASAGAVAALTACGGGGGGTDGDGGATPGPAPVPTTLVITADNMANIASLSTGWAESVLWFGEMAIDFAGRFRHSAADQSQSCPNGGVLALRLVDRDGNGRLSAGDAVVADLRECTVPIAGNVLVGTLTVEVASSVDAPRSMRGTVSLGPAGVNAVFGTGPSAEYLGLKGSVAFEGSTSDVATTLTVKSTAADDFSVSGRDGTRSVTERVREFDIARTLQYDEARARTRIQLRYDSEVLGGTVTVTTPQPLQAYLDTYPEQGQIVVRGSGGRALYLTPNFVTNSAYASVGLDSNGDERVDTTVLLPWSDVSAGYLWWNGRGTAPAMYSTQSYSATAFSYTALGYGQPVGVNDPIVVQFSRPPVNPPALRFRLRDQGATDGYDPQRLDIEADTAFQGALLVVRPRTPAATRTQLRARGLHRRRCQLAVGRRAAARRARQCAHLLWQRLGDDGRHDARQHRGQRRTADGCQRRRAPGRIGLVERTCDRQLPLAAAWWNAAGHRHAGRGRHGTALGTDAADGSGTHHVGADGHRHRRRAGNVAGRRQRNRRHRQRPGAVLPQQRWRLHRRRADLHRRLQHRFVLDHACQQQLCVAVVHRLGLLGVVVPDDGHGRWFAAAGGRL